MLDEEPELKIKDGVLIAYKGSKDSLEIPYGVTEIADGVFYLCTNLNNIIIPEGVYRIGKRAFFGCKNLKMVTLPNSIQKIAYSSFKDCCGLQKVFIPKKLVAFIGEIFPDAKDIKYEINTDNNVSPQINNLDNKKSQDDCAVKSDVSSKNVGATSSVLTEYAEYLKHKDSVAAKPAKKIKFSKNDFTEEAVKLQITISDIDEDILNRFNSIEAAEETWWMDNDQKLRELGNRAKNSEIYKAINALKELKLAPYFARMDVGSDKYSDETFYIGEKEYSYGTTSICSVWSDFGKQFRNRKVLAFNVAGTDYVVQLRRRLDINNGELNGYSDEYKAGSSVGRSNITDPFLIEVLKRKRSERRLTNIISTIQQKQNDIIDYNFYKDVIVQGCAGSGKTMILLHRLANMRFNELKYDFSRVKIITPNDNFNLFIGGLSENLGIAGITKTTLSGYYISLLGRFHADIAKGANNSRSEREAYERSLLADENDVPLEIRQVLYSEKFLIDVRDFMEKIKSEDALKSEKNKKDIGDLIGRLPKSVEQEEAESDADASKRTTKSVLERLLKAFNLDVNCKKNYNCVLYLKVLVLYCYYGPLNSFYDTMLCIDEAQDIALVQFDLLKKVNGRYIRFNLFGDVNQQIDDNVNLGNWDEIKVKLSAQLFTLQENYRNSENIVNFYNSELGFSDSSFGLSTRDVTKIKEEQVIDIMKLSANARNRTVVICKDKQVAEKYLSENTVWGKVEKGKISLMTVKEAKGLEFDTAIVLAAGMSRNQKYISFTRALNDLFVVD